MKIVGMALIAAAAFGQQPQAAPRIVAPLQVKPLPEAGFKEIFDGQSFRMWDCDPEFWRVEGGEMIGETTAGHQPAQNIFCIWRGGTVGDFELKLQYKLTGTTGNSGIQYRSFELPDVARWVLKGYQADIDGNELHTGQVYEERGRTYLAQRGQAVYIGAGQKPGTFGSLGTPEDLRAAIHTGDWNEIHIIARGNTIIQLLNGRVTSIVIDDDPAGRKLDGLLAVQLHKTAAAMKIEAKNIRLKVF